MRVNVGAPPVACKERSSALDDVTEARAPGYPFRRAQPLLSGGDMKHVLSVLLVAGAMAVAACSDRDGASRPLGLAAAADSSGDSIPGPKPGPLASGTVSPPSASVVLGDSADFFADLPDREGDPARDAHVKGSVGDPNP